MKKEYLILSIVVVVAAAAVIAWFLWLKSNEPTPVVTTPTEQVVVPANPNNEPVEPAIGMQKYSNTEYAFSLEYSADFKKLSDDDMARLPWSYGSAKPGRRLFTIELAKDFMPQTNFSEAIVSVGVSADAADVAACLLSDSGTAEKEVINTTSFTKIAFSDAGAGNFYETKSYRVLRNNVCLALEATTHSTNIDNYPPEQGIKKFDAPKIDAALNTVIQSFRFE